MKVEVYCPEHKEMSEVKRVLIWTRKKGLRVEVHLVCGHYVARDISAKEILVSKLDFP